MSIDKVKKIFHNSKDIIILSPSGKKIMKKLVDYRTTLIPISGDIKIIDENINLKNIIKEHDETILKLKNENTELEKRLNEDILYKELEQYKNIHKRHYEFNCSQQNIKTTIIKCGNRIKQNKCSDKCRDLRNWLSSKGIKI